MRISKVFIVILMITINMCWNAIEGKISLQGKYSNHLNSGDILIPRKVNHAGEHISHNVTNHHNCTLEDRVHYNFTFGNDTWHLELEPHNYFIAPQMIIERHKRDVKIRNYPSKNLNCHYIGKVRGHTQSRVALSSCNGLTGHIKTKNSEYFIEPIKHINQSAHDNGHPHVIFHRSAVPEKRRKNHHHHHHRRKKKHSKSNCGTKEPKRRTETRIEWQPQGKVIIQGGRKVRRHHHHNYQQHIQHHNHHHHQHNRNNNYQHKQNQHKNLKSATTTTRIKRSISRPRHVETLIVADSTMVQFHDDIEQYLLTIMNMVSSFYKDPTIGNAIEVVVVKMIYLEDDDDTNPLLNLTESAQRNLDIFCSYQHKLNTNDDNDAHHHDAAILITRKNICGNDCMTLGLANVGGMCKPRKSCSVNEDNGIMLAHTIAHELGHNFGMYHDTMKIGCHGRTGPIVHIMTPTFVADTIQVSWSNCSRKYITHFLDQGLGKCLDDSPRDIEYPYPDLPPGAMYNADLQCRLQFNVTDEDIHVCSAPHEICSQLWCQVNGECMTNMRPTAPGTKCGKHKWCQNGKCVPIEDDPPVPVNGGWGNWSDWSECSRTCGGGVSIQYRECNNPSPANEGLFCIGERKRYTICNKDKCPENEPNFRAVQCSKFNNSTYQGAKYKWLPYFDKYNPCKLFCTDEDDTVIANWADVTADGTPCEIGTKNMCIDGICRKVGCDWIVDSKKKEDRCGICDGTDELCEPVRDTFTEKFNITGEYVEILTIPPGARHIIIKELEKSPNFLSIGKSNSTQFYLNGDRLISMSGEFFIAGAESMYDREDEKETIQIPYPIEHSISVYVFVRDEENTGISYEFTLPILNSTSISTYSWKLGDWTACSATCGGGLQYRMPLCYENQNTLVDEELCWSNTEKMRPHQLNRICNDIPCPAHWWIGPWQLCPVTCKKTADSDPMRRRSVMCLDHNDIALPEARCNNEQRPLDTESCDKGIPSCSPDDITSNLV